ncbi:MAG: helix-turn-helix transcriptional regulator [Hamadaea sp.]|nr:helix-turn-helix transcriptional regulator [Hamadaea sp.]
MSGESFGARLRTLRERRGLSLRQLSDLSHVDFGHLSRIENGRRKPTDGVANAVDIALEADGVLIAMAKVERAGDDRQGVTSDPMRRRTLVTTPLAAAIASLGGVSDAAQRVGQVGVGDAERLGRAVIRIRTLGHQHGGEDLWQAAAGVAQNGYHLLEHGAYSESVGEMLLTATGRAQMCAGWLAFDSGAHDVARSCYNEALSLARQTADSSIEVHALANLAFQSTFLGMPRQSLRYAEAAERVAFGRMAVVPQIRQATAYAYAGDPNESHRAMAQARIRFDSAPEDGEDWCAFVSPAELDGIEGTAAIKLRESRRAETLLLRAIAAHDDGFARNRALYRVRLAQARLDLGDADGAALAANEALDDLSGEVASFVVSAELASVAQQLAAFPQLPDVERFIARYTADR